MSRNPPVGFTIITACVPTRRDYIILTTTYNRRNKRKLFTLDIINLREKREIVRSTSASPQIRPV